MESKTNQETTVLEETELNQVDDPILPEGWTDGDDFFNEGAWSGNDADEDFFADSSKGISSKDESVSGDPTTDTTEQTGQVEAQSEESEPPTTEETQPTLEAPIKLKFKARIDHEDVEAEIDESDLPTLYQKATATDRYQAKLAKVNPTLEKLERMAKANGYESGAAMLEAQEAYEREATIEKLMGAGTPKEIAEDYVERRFGSAPTLATNSNLKPETTRASDPGSTANTKQTPPARDFASEVRSLWEMRPDLKGVTIPSEVAAAAAGGQNLALAYFAYEAQQAKASAETLRKENAVFKQNAEAAKKAPVRGVSGGGSTDTQPKDPFLEGFDSDW